MEVNVLHELYQLKYEHNCKQNDNS